MPKRTDSNWGRDSRNRRDLTGRDYNRGSSQYGRSYGDRDSSNDYQSSDHSERQYGQRDSGMRDYSGSTDYSAGGQDSDTRFLSRDFGNGSYGAPRSDLRDFDRNFGRGYERSNNDHGYRSESQGDLRGQRDYESTHYGRGYNLGQSGYRQDDSYSRNQWSDESNPQYGMSTNNDVFATPRSYNTLNSSNSMERGYRDSSYERARDNKWGRSEHSEGMMEKIGRFFGVGPKNYKRSDERVREDVSEALYRDPHVDASSIEVEVKEGVVVLSGTVETRYAKRQAEDCIHDITGVRDVTNNLRVEAPSMQSQAVASPSSASSSSTSTSTSSKSRQGLN